MAGEESMNDAIRVVSVCLALSAGLVAGCGNEAGRSAGDAFAQSALPASAAAQKLAVAARSEPVVDAPGFYAGESGLTPSERAGREIWYKATAGNSRFHTYVFQQRVNVFIDWYRVLNARDHDDRFKAWGLINDPGCCMPGAEGCPATSLDETYGFQWCPGDDQLLPYVGKEGYRDPACDFRDAPVDPTDPHAKSADQRQSPCDLEFGTSTGALGYRKFPNPRFDRKRWLALNGSPASWEGYRGAMSKDGAPPSDAERNRLADGSIEPPFLIGTTCGSCHIAFDPLNPPVDPERPAWENLKGAVGNQYTRVSEILTSGMPGNTLEVQMFSYTRPGTTDTSAIPNDQVYNPGTMNAIINTDVRPRFDNEQVLKWRKVKSCPAAATGQADANECRCERGNDKCWQRSLKPETVHHILKGGEDSIGADEAVQRVYFNIGSCAEQCWLNHLTDLRQLDPTMRNFGQTPFDIGQCRRDCPNFRAIEDRLSNIVAFLKSSETNATDLRVAREQSLRKRNPKATFTQKDLVRELNGRFGAGAVERGRALFAANCARCHSSIPVEEGGDFASRDFYAENERGMRTDWMGSDRPTPVTEIETNRCRALHSNHMTGHIWQEYGSETLRKQPPLQGLTEPHDGGRGYYRNISLLSAWAHAPFMHNNAVGPELCGRPANAANDFYRSPYVDANRKVLPDYQAPSCWAYDPSVDGRLKLYIASMTDLLNPAARTPKISHFDQDVRIALGPRTWDGKEEKQVAGFTVVLPAGTSVNGIASFRHKTFVNDLLLAKLHPDELDSRLTQELGREQGAAVASELRQIAGEIVADPERLVDVIRDHRELADYYSSCTDLIENLGHPFGEGLSPADKNALIAFVATL